MAEFLHQPFKDYPNAVGPEPGDDVSYRLPDAAGFARLRRNRIAEGFAFALASHGRSTRLRLEHISVLAMRTEKA